MASSDEPYRSRLAPSPTGALHFGNARSFLLTWFRCRQQKGSLTLRIEDLHLARIKPGAMEQIFDDLRFLGITWEEGPQSIEELPTHPHLVQSNNVHRYEEILQELHQAGRIYPCSCTRKEVEMAQSAPHQEGELRYPGTCRGRWKDEAEATQAKGHPAAWRFRIQGGTTHFVDHLHGTQSSSLEAWSGDFVVATEGRQAGYQLAVVVDDHDQGITEVVRGDDLLPSTHRQIQIYEALGWEPPTTFHLPLVIGPDGKRLAKRHGDWKLSTLRQGGHSREAVLGLMAQTLGWTQGASPLSLDAMEDLYLHQPLKREASVLSVETAQRFGV